MIMLNFRKSAKGNDEIDGHQWVGLTASAIFMNNKINIFKQLVMDNKEGGLVYLACLCNIQDDIQNMALYIEDTLGIRTNWMTRRKQPEDKMSKPNINIGDSYFYDKTMNRAHDLLTKSKEGVLTDEEQV